MIGVDFIASIGIRHLVLAAKALARSSCKLVLLDPNPLVTGVLITTGCRIYFLLCALKTKQGPLWHHLEAIECGLTS